MGPSGGTEDALVVVRHLDDLRRRNLRHGTITQRRLALGRLRRHLGPRPLLAAGHDDLTAFTDRASLAPESRATEISHLRGFYKWAVLEQLLDVDPTVRLVRPKVPRRMPRPMATADLAMAIQLAPDRIRPWLALAAYAGLRAIEISQLRADDLWWENDPPLLLVADGKGGQPGSVAISPDLEAELRAARLPSRGWLFPRHDGQPGHTPAHGVSHLTNAYLHSIGISSTLHQARHWFGSEAYRASGRDLRQTQELLRHRSPVSTALYTYVDPGEAAATLSRLPSLR